MRRCWRGLRTVETLNEFTPKLRSRSVSWSQQTHTHTHTHTHLKRRKDGEECERWLVDVKVRLS